MNFLIQMRGRQWPDSMGWQDTDFLPDDRTPAEWVAMMNEGDSQIEYRLAPCTAGKAFVLRSDQVELLVECLNLRHAQLQSEAKYLNDQMNTARTDAEFDSCGRSLSSRLDDSVEISSLLALFSV